MGIEAERLEGMAHTVVEREVDPLQLHPARLDLREVEDLVDHAEEGVGGRRASECQVLPLLGVSSVMPMMPSRGLRIRPGWASACNRALSSAIEAWVANASSRSISAGEKGQVEADARLRGGNGHPGKTSAPNGWASAPPPPDRGTPRWPAGGRTRRRRGDPKDRRPGARDQLFRRQEHLPRQRPEIESAAEPTAQVVEEREVAGSADRVSVATRLPSVADDRRSRRVTRVCTTWSEPATRAVRQRPTAKTSQGPNVRVASSCSQPRINANSVRLTPDPAAEPHHHRSLPRAPGTGRANAHLGGGRIHPGLPSNARAGPG